MNGQELATAVQHDAQMLVLVIDNGAYGTIRMHQEREFRDIARCLGISERGAQRHMARALQALETQLGADLPPEILAAPAARKRGDHE